MNLIINHTSIQPIYDQVVSQIKDKIIHGELLEQAMLPSVRTLAKDLKISALTVKKAYDQLEQEGFVTTVHGKVESEFEQAIRKARSCGLENSEIRELFEIVLEES